MAASSCIELTPAESQALLRAARDAITSAVSGTALPVMPSGAPPVFGRPGAAFVSLHQPDGALRGCIGSLEAFRPLFDDVVGNAQAAARRDPRFRPVMAAELPGLAVSLSVLSAPQPLCVASESDLKSKLRPGIDGLVIDWRGHRATFLPVVWEQLPDVDDFLRHLKVKAGLPADFWAPDMTFSVYQAQKID